jgi:viroplasmin and RNaseH domain-containing protein
MAKKAYVVFCGRRTGIYTDWPTCNAQVNGYSNAVFVGYDSIEEAEKAWVVYLRDMSSSSQAGHNSEDLHIHPRSTISYFVLKLGVIILMFWIISKLF